MADKKPETYKKIKEIGKGACGKAYLVQAESSKKYAVIKQVDINAIKSREEREKIYQVLFTFLSVS
jgi:serine/threonine protein kinase